jgi:hypothetical protein
MISIKRGIKAPQWCRGCGKKVHEDDPHIARVAIGQLHSLEKGRERFEEDVSSLWGYMHEECFLLAVGDPAAIRNKATPFSGLVPTTVTD